MKNVQIFKKDSLHTGEVGLGFTITAARMALPIPMIRYDALVMHVTEFPIMADSSEKKKLSCKAISLV